MVYDQDKESDAFYIIKRGRAAIQSIVTLNSENTFPQQATWKSVKTTKKCMYKIRELGPGEIFGHDELLKHF